MTKYDIAEWHPITVAQFVEALGVATLVVDEVSTLRNEIETLPDGRVRTVHFATMVSHDDHGVPAGVVSPYLMHIYDAETSKSILFMANSADLALG